MKRTGPICLFVLLVSTVPALAGNGHHHTADHAQAPVAELRAGATVSPPALFARYELSTGARGIDWYLTRADARIETFNAASRQAEIWERVPTGGIEYRRIFLGDRRIVEYTPGELKSRRAEPDWSALASLVAPAKIAGLRKAGERTVLGRRAVILEGKIDGAQTRLWWLPEAQLPARLERGQGKRLVRINLRELHDRPPAGWPLMNEAHLSDFALIDAADFGDMEYDAFVQKVMSQDGHAHGHGHQ
jgi:hypothetical protein